MGRRRLWFCRGLVLGAAMWNGAQAQTTGAFDGQYVGQLSLTSVVSGDCTEPPEGALYPFDVSGGIVRFKYVPRFNTVLSGYVHADGTFEATRRLRTGAIVMTGRIDGGSVTAEIRSPSCNYAFSTGE